MRRIKPPKCPKCDMSYSLSLVDKQAHCGSCQHTWKPAPSVLQKIVAQLEYDAAMRQAKALHIEREKQAAEARAAVEARRWRRDDRGWVISEDELDLDRLSTEELVEHRDRLTGHLDSLVDHGFADGKMSEASHDDDCEPGHCVGGCLVVEAARRSFLNAAYRDHSGQLSLDFP